MSFIEEQKKKKNQDHNWKKRRNNKKYMLRRTEKSCWTFHLLFLQILDPSVSGAVTLILWSVPLLQDVPFCDGASVFGDREDKVPKSLVLSTKCRVRKWRYQNTSKLEDEIHERSTSSRTPLFSNYLFRCPNNYFEKKLLNLRFPEAHYNVFHDCTLSSQKEPKSFDGLEISYKVLFSY